MPYRRLLALLVTISSLALPRPAWSAGAPVGPPSGMPPYMWLMNRVNQEIMKRGGPLALQGFVFMTSEAKAPRGANAQQIEAAKRAWAAVEQKLPPAPSDAPRGNDLQSLLHAYGPRLLPEKEWQAYLKASGGSSGKPETFAAQVDREMFNRRAQAAHDQLAGKGAGDEGDQDRDADHDPSTAAKTAEEKSAVELEAKARTQADPGLRARLLLTAAWGHQRAGDADRSLAILDEVEPTVASDPWLLAHVFLVRGATLQGVGALAPAFDQFRKALDPLRSSTGSPVVPIARDGVCRADSAFTRPLQADTRGDAKGSLRAPLTLHATLSERAATAREFLSPGIFDAMVGFSRAWRSGGDRPADPARKEILGRLGLCFQQMLDAGRIAFLRRALDSYDYDVTYYDAAERGWRTLADLTGDHNKPALEQVERLAKLRLGRALLAAGQNAKAAPLLKETLEKLLQGGGGASGGATTEALEGFALATPEAHRAAEVQPYLKRVEEWVDRAGRPDPPGLARLAVVQAMLGQPQVAEGTLGKSRSSIAQVPSNVAPAMRMEVELAACRIAEGRGDLGDAVAACERAVALGDRVGEPSDIIDLRPLMHEHRRAALRRAIALRLSQSNEEAAFALSERDEVPELRIRRGGSPKGAAGASPDVTAMEKELDREIKTMANRARQNATNKDEGERLEARIASVVARGERPPDDSDPTRWSRYRLVFSQYEPWVDAEQRTRVGALIDRYEEALRSERRADLDARGAAIEAKLAVLDERARAAKRDDGTGAETSRALRKMEEAQQTERALLVKELDRARNVATAGLDGSPTTSLAALQERISPQVALVAYVPLDRELVVFVVTRGKHSVVRVPVGVNELLGAIEEASAPAASTDPASPVFETLHGWLIDSWRDQPLAGVDRLAVVAHGVTAFVPFAALKKGDRYLTQDVSVFMLARATDLEERREADGAPPRVLALARTATPGLPMLPSARREVDAIGQRFETVAFNGRDATESRLRSEAEKFPVVHIAAHGELNAREPMMSHVVLSPGAGHDGSLEAHEIRNLTLPATRLVVLSACRTAGSLNRGAEGGSLSDAFLRAGARSVVSTLWEVQDDATLAFMERFYDRLREGGDTAVALRDAQSDVRGKFPHPYYWASFVLRGNPTSLFAPKI